MRQWKHHLSQFARVVRASAGVRRLFAHPDVADKGVRRLDPQKTRIPAA